MSWSKFNYCNDSWTAHGFEAGKPITIRGLDSIAVAGNGAEGTFIVNTVPITTTLHLHILQKQKLVQLQEQHYTLYTVNT